MLRRYKSLLFYFISLNFLFSQNNSFPEAAVAAQEGIDLFRNPDYENYEQVKDYTKQNLS